MNYTLYIDESGDFETQKGQWVISGVLLSDSYENCENKLSNKFKSIPSKLGIESIREFHLTEFRREFSHEKVLNIAKHTIGNLDEISINHHLLAVINTSKISLKVREKTYRLMLLDLLALCETVIPENEVIDNLDLIVATRTIEGVRQTSVSDIQVDIINSLPSALEVDLATKGMVDLIGKHINIKMDYANNSWGLVCADFIANLTYHNRKQLEIEYLSILKKEGKYSQFDSFGGYAVRRARVADRNGDYSLSLYRWLIISSQNTNDSIGNDEINRLLIKILDQGGTTGQKTSIESLLERLWRISNVIGGYKKLSVVMHLLDDEISKVIADQSLEKFTPLLFRIRNMMLLVENHLGVVEKSIHIIEKQESMIALLAQNPENFQMILDCKVHQIEVFINSLDIPSALDKAVEYRGLVENYKEVWGLLTNGEDLSGFAKSRANIKSEMALLRCENLSISDGQNDIDKMLKRFSTIEALLDNKSDLSRLQNYKIFFYLKQKMLCDVVQYCYALYSEKLLTDKMNPFDLFWLLNAINSVLLHNISNEKVLYLAQGSRFQIEQIGSNESGHPIDLIWREAALFEFINGNKTAALKSIRKSKNTFNLVDSPISRWLQIMVEVYHDYVKDDEKFIDFYVDDKLPNFWKIKEKPNIKTLHLVREISPY